MEKLRFAILDTIFWSRFQLAGWREFEEVECVALYNRTLAKAEAMEEAGVGRPFRAHIFYANSFPVFDNQPFLKELDQFILTDIGSHILDTARYSFGDAQSLYCQTASITPGIKGDKVTVKNEGTFTKRCTLPRYSWADPAYDVIHSSIVGCNGNLLQALLNGQPAETDAHDNIKTMRLLFGAYESVQKGQIINF